MNCSFYYILECRAPTGLGDRATDGYTEHAQNFGSWTWLSCLSGIAEETYHEVSDYAMESCKLTAYSSAEPDRWRFLVVRLLEICVLLTCAYRRGYRTCLHHTLLRVGVAISCSAASKD